VTLDGGGDADLLHGGRGPETLLGGNGVDVIDGNGGDDIAFLGSGADTFVWDPGDGRDVVEGQSGGDTLDFRGSGASELLEVSPNGPRLEVRRDRGDVSLDVDDVEHIEVRALGGSDITTVGDTSGTGLRRVTVNLSGVVGAPVPDKQPDLVLVNGGLDDDHVSISGEEAGVAIRGLNPTIVIAGSRAEDPDGLILDTRDGQDTVTFGGGLDALIRTIVRA
jgi:Ca2+-binding RTX toxin-like protein